MTTVRSSRWCCGVFRRLSRRPATGLSTRSFTADLAFVKVGYDNERGKGDHRHLDGVETAYVFTSVEKLLADFWLDVRTKRGER